MFFDAIVTFACTVLGENDENCPTGWPTFQLSFEIMNSQKRRRYSEVCGSGYELYRSSESVVVVVLVLAGWHGGTGRCYALHLLQVTHLARWTGVNGAGTVCCITVVCNWQTKQGGQLRQPARRNWLFVSALFKQYVINSRCLQENMRYLQDLHCPSTQHPLQHSDLCTHCNTNTNVTCSKQFYNCC